MTNRRSLTREEAYETLVISPEASPIEVRKAFVSLSLKYHPDKAGPSKKVHEKYIRIRACYDFLMEARQPAEPQRTPPFTSSPDQRSPRPPGPNRNSGNEPRPPFSRPNPPWRPTPRDYSSLNPPPSDEAPVPREQHRALGQVLGHWFAENISARSDEAKMAGFFASVFKHVGTALCDAVTRLQRLPPGGFGHEMVKALHEFVTENEDFMALVRLIVEGLPEGDGEANRQQTNKTVELELLTGLAIAPRPPVYYSAPTACW
ncbi:uncharacterized protein JN550_012060 [Neoarthrinium moseri]|uniref:uncharacterized protein n=1 Tax=Neoarthrinium moseri TaxID=1658444 RepID=UPI001FDE1ABA|nr:uncharacterized protein JN550_012060 [Neoarthrinium moseri]KAI1859542.1 hypothetical protein JN550_012060 [Neoarthrinium moseri]